MVIIFGTLKTHGFLASIILLFLFTTIIFSGCTKSNYQDNKPSVVVSIVPQLGFVKNIAGTHINTNVMVPSNADPHSYEPKPSQMKVLSKAKIYFKVGSGLEFELAWMNRLIAINPSMNIIDCAKGIKLIDFREEHPDHENAHGTGKDPHIWMSPPNAITMVNNITDGLIQVDPENGSYYEENRKKYVQNLTELDKNIREKLSKVKNRAFLVYHPSYGYFAQEYNLTMLTIEEEGKEPTASDLAIITKKAQENNIKVVFASPQFNPQSARVLAKAIKGKVILIDPLAQDYIANMQFLLNELMQIME